MTGVVGALVEAWEELRLHRLRVLLSLVGIALSVTAMTTVLALGRITGQAQEEMSDRSMGRQTTLTVSAFPAAATSSSVDVVPAMRALVERYEVTYSSVVVSTNGRFRAAGATFDTQLSLVDPAYGTIHRVQVAEGVWFAPADVDRLAPALVVNEAFMRAIGSPPLASHPVATIPGPRPVTTVVIGVVPDLSPYDMPTAYALYDAYTRMNGAPLLDPEMGYVPTLELWVPPSLGEEGLQAVRSDLTGALGEGTQVDVWSNDVPGQEGVSRVFESVVLGVGFLLLFLGALSLVNISMVTVRQRIREIGIRRSFGATSGRVFVSIMLESVVATAVAGLVGVGLAVLIVRNLPLEAWLGFTLQDQPAFPLSVALVGILAATAVGAVAGLLPATVAVRVRPIDAIRY